MTAIQQASVAPVYLPSTVNVPNNVCFSASALRDMMDYITI